MRRLLFALAAALVLTLPAAPAANNWPQYAYDETHQGRVPANLNNEFRPWTERWWDNLSLPAKPGSPVVFDDVVYLGAADGRLYALDRESGGEIWSVLTASGAKIDGTPAVWGDNVYILTDRGRIHAYDRKTGAAIAGYPINVGSSALGSLLALPFQNLLIGASGSTIRSFFANTQEQKWTFNSAGTFFADPPNEDPGVACPGGSIEGTPVAFQHFIFFGSTNKCFYAIDNRAFGTISNTGTGSNRPIWIFQGEDSIRSSPTIDIANNRVLFGDQSGNIYAIAVNSFQKVAATPIYTEPRGSLSSEFKSTPAIHDGHVYVASRNGNVNKLTLTGGTKVWTQALGNEVVGNLAIANAHLLVGTMGQPPTGRTMYMLNATDGVIVDQRQALSTISQNPIITGTQGVWASDDGALHSFGGTKPPRADLEVTNLQPRSMTTGGGNTVSATIRNVGVLPSEATSAIFRVTVGTTTTTLAEVDVRALNPGDDVRITSSYTPARTGTITLSVHVDPHRLVKETSEENNRMQLSVTVLNPPPVVEDPTPEPAPAPAAILLVLMLLALAVAIRRRRQP